eukprot:GHVL01034459.1.p1 GENE.GHVL01034459.1~~GHVL01034459.1.p1  ORF type:complete len:138 (+),score=11.36 GHVL01034459.1:97-510(+)
MTRFKMSPIRKLNPSPPMSTKHTLTQSWRLTWKSGPETDPNPSPGPANVARGHGCKTAPTGHPNAQTENSLRTRTRRKDRIRPTSDAPQNPQPPTPSKRTPTDTVVFPHTIPTIPPRRRRAVHPARHNLIHGPKSQS